MTKSSIGLLTAKQLEVLRMISEGLTQTEIAERLHTSRQNISILLARARKNIITAQETLSAIQKFGVAAKVRIPEGTHILDAAKEVLKNADKKGIRIKDDAISITAFLRSRMRSSIESGRLTKEVELIIMPNGDIMLV